MNFTIRHETNRRIRLRLYCPKITPAQEEIMRFAFSSIRGIQNVTFYPETSGVALTYSEDEDRERILSRMRAFDFSNVEMMADELEHGIGMDEMMRRKLDPALKRRLRARILVETAADILLPVPLQLGYHVYQLITLKDI